MAQVEHIEEWRGEEVLDSAGEKIGKLDEVYIEVGTGRSVFGRVKSGMLGRHATVVSLLDATVGRGYVRLASSAEQHERASALKIDGDVLTRDTARELAIYGLDLPSDVDYESASMVQARQERAAQASREADALEQDALARAQDSAAAQQTAEQSAQDAELAAREAEQAARRAAEARATSDVHDQP